MGYGAIIKEIRKSKNMSLREFAKRVDLDFTYIGLLEREKSTSNKPLNPTIAVLKQICDRTGYPFRQFLEEAGYIEPTAADNELTEIYSQLDEINRQRLLFFAKGLLSNASTLEIPSPNIASTKK